MATRYFDVAHVEIYGEEGSKNRNKRAAPDLHQAHLGIYKGFNLVSRIE
jgi:hypothetical protein